MFKVMAAALVLAGGLTVVGSPALAATPATADVRSIALSGNRIGVLTGADPNRGMVAKVKEGGLSASFVTEYSGVRELVLAGNRIGIVTDDLSVLVKEGGLSAGWVKVGTGERLVMSGNRIGIVTGEGDALVKEGGLTAPWVKEYGPSVFQVKLSGNRIGVLTQFRDALVKEGSLSAGWVLESPDVINLVVSGDRISVLGHYDGINRVKAGGLSASWSKLPIGDYAVLSGDRIGALTFEKDGSSKAVVNEGSVLAPFVTEHADTIGLALDGDRIGVVLANHTALVKDGGLSASWVTQ